jgi:glycerol kinase
MASPLVLAIDQGTTSTRAIMFDAAGAPVAMAQRELPQIYPKPGWVEHDAERIWADTVAVCVEAIDKVGRPPACIGLTNQRETVVLWERATGRPVANAIVWQDRRTAARCDALRRESAEPLVQARTGLLLDPYFSATKLEWLLDEIPGARAAAEAGRLAFGTIDSWLLWKLTEGRAHATDATNASRTLLYDIRKQDWDEELLSIFHVPGAVLPEVRDSSGAFGETRLFGGRIAIAGIAGDQQAAAFGQACFAPGMIKSTYGTGCFALLHTGEAPVVSRKRLLTTIACRIGGRTTYALEGAIFVAGAAVQWLRDELRLIDAAAESEGLAGGVASTGGVYLVPAFVGLGAPYWDAEARGALIGLTRASGRAEIVRAALESVAYQTRDLLEAMADDAGRPIETLRVDGGMVANDWLLQFMADATGVTVERPEVTETTALGAACLAGLHAGVYGSLAEIGRRWRCERRFAPVAPSQEREALYAGWREAVGRVLTSR